MATKYKVGRNCDSWCTKCKLTLEHVIVSMVGSRPARVQCLTCKSNHNFRQAPSSKKSTKKGVKMVSSKSKAKSSGPRSKTSRTRGPGGKNWNTLITERDTSKARRYKLTATFENEELIDHSRFGMGIVLEAVPDKIEVLFEDGARTLAHSR
ncbi:MAG TPA: hypothetical protein VLU25_18515 [Acidobacteriota bacterium]|nr:hypothetical protein [Acidobacteriota bacterium]